MSRIEQAEIFAEDSTLYWDSIAELTKKLGGHVTIFADEITFLEASPPGGLSVFDGVSLPWTYDTYRIVNLALQGIEWFNWLNRELQEKRSKRGVPVMRMSEKSEPMTVPSITEMICERKKRNE